MRHCLIIHDLRTYNTVITAIFTTQRVTEIVAGMMFYKLDQNCRFFCALSYRTMIHHHPCSTFGASGSLQCSRRMDKSERIGIRDRFLDWHGYVARYRILNRRRSAGDGLARRCFFWRFLWGMHAFSFRDLAWKMKLQLTAWSWWVGLCRLTTTLAKVFPLPASPHNKVTCTLLSALCVNAHIAYRRPRHCMLHNLTCRPAWPALPMSSGSRIRLASAAPSSGMPA